ncbi:MAG: hypothetical protein RL297_336 [Pseudomonadota bacterium]|jgi:hypothetical protein
MHYVIDLQIEPDAKGLDPYGKPWAPLATSTLYRAIEAKEQSITRIGNKKRGASSNIASCRKFKSASPSLWFGACGG